MATRLQLRRTKGWRKPAGAVVVARPTRWGNPYAVADHGPERAVELFRTHLTRHPELADAVRLHLAGCDLACWCPPAMPCHADVLLEVANPPAACPHCSGSGWTTEIHRVGRGRIARPVGEVGAICPTCLGTGN